MSRLVSIVLATYRPNEHYLEAQLTSINNQDYENIEVLIRDDSEDESSFNKVIELARKILMRKKFSINRNNQNLGSNKTFEILTLEASGDYIAYCDQDDVWEKDKISKLVDKIERENSVMCYSDLSVIDANGIQIAKSFRNMNRRVKHLYGDNLFSYLLRRNSVTGCTMLIKAEIARQSVPFCHEYYVHDHWLALCSSMHGKISYVNEPLVKYRIHESNQIGASILTGITTKDDYVNKKLAREQEKYDYLLNNYGFNHVNNREIEALRKWTLNKVRFLNHASISNSVQFIKGIKVDAQLTFFELIIKFLPNIVLGIVLKKIKN